MKTYEAKEIKFKSLNGKQSQHFNIMEAGTDDKICTCYGSDKAELVTSALNKYENK